MGRSGGSGPRGVLELAFNERAEIGDIAQARDFGGGKPDPEAAFYGEHETHVSEAVPGGDVGSGQSRAELGHFIAEDVAERLRQLLWNRLLHRTEHRLTRGSVIV